MPVSHYRVAVFLNRFGAWRATRAEAIRDAVEMGEAREDDDGQTYLNPGVRIETMQWRKLR